MERLFFSDSTALFNEKPKKLGTVQHVCNPGTKKCCTVPKFLCLGTKNLGTVPKKPKKPILQNLQAWEALKVLENRFFSDSTALFNEKPKK